MSRTGFLASPLILALALSLVGPRAFALGVGALRVQSALNQPFAGEIELLDIKPDELDEVKARIASIEEFGKVGAERYHYLAKLRFVPQLSARGRPVIAVSSREPIREPYMDFLVEVQWSKGQTVREFTVLLDPPTTARRAAPPSASPAAVPARSAPPPVARPAERPRAPAPAPEPLPAAPDAGYPKTVGPVRSGVGLWQLATRHTPPGATAAQTAMALFRNNQGAFIGGNINRLVAGKTLVIPSAAELLALEPEAAQRELKAALRDEPVRSAPIAPATAAGTDDQARLRIAGTAAPRPAAPGPAGMEQELLLVREASESARQETVELRGRIRELESQLSEIQQLLQLRNAELARIQQQGGAAAPGEPVASAAPATPAAETPPPASPAVETATAPPVPETPAAAPTAALQPPGASPAAGTESGQPEAPVPAPASVPAAQTVPAAGTPASPGATAPAAENPVAVAPLPPPAAPAAPAPAVAKPAPVADDIGTDSVWDILLLPLAGIAGVTGLGIAALVWWRSRRRRLAQGDDSVVEPDSGETADESVFSEPSSGAVRTAPPVAGGLAAVAIGGADASVAGPSLDASSLQPHELESDESDAISEADIYIAYGRYREAEELLREEIARAPKRVELKLKLAEAYLGARNREALQALVQELQAAGVERMSPQQWQRLTEIAQALQSDDEPADPRPAPPRPAPVAPVVSPAHDSLDLGSDDVFSLDVADLPPLPVESVPPSTGVRPLSAPAFEVPRLAPVSPAGTAFEDDLSLIMDADSLSPDLVLDEDSEEMDLDLPIPAIPASVPEERPAADTLPTLTLDIEEPKTDLAQPWTDSARVLQLDEDLVLPGLPSPDVGIEPLSARLPEPLPDLLGIPEGGGSSELESQWQMDAGVWDETATKLELARAYFEMGDKESTRGILEEVIKEGTETQRAEAHALLQRVG